MREKPKRKLQAKLIVRLLALAILLGVTLSCVITSRYRQSMEDYYAKIAFDQATIAADIIDGDTINRYAQTLEKDAYYHEISDYLMRVKQTVGLKYFYVVIPYENDMYYIWDAGGDQEKGVCDIGTRESYYGDGKEIMRGAFLTPGEETILVTDNDTYGYLASAYVAILDSSGTAVALSCVDISMEMINNQITQFILVITLTIVGILLFFMIGYFAFIKWALLRPIEQLNLATKTMVSENIDALADFNLNIHTRDELESLAEAFTHMAHKLHDYIIDLTAITAEKERIGAELDVARHIQASMLPSIFPAFPERPELDIYATMIPAKEVGGDFYDFFLIDDDHLGMVMADVSGKGVPAALFMVIAKTLLKNVAQTGLSPKSVLEKVNKQLCVGNDAEMFVTVWLGILEISTGKLSCANAGHEYPVLRRANGRYELLKDRHGFVLAGMEHSRYTEYEIQLYPCDRIFLYTDGVPEATNASNELYGTGRMLDALNHSEGSDCKQLLAALKLDIDTFVGDSPQFDDITMLSLTLMPADTFGMQKLKLPPTLEAMAKVTAFVEQSMEDAGMSMKLIAQMNIAVDEIFSNIALYSGATDATVGVKVSNGGITLRFADNGLPYDPTANAAPDTTLSAEEREVGGLGLFMVKKFMDTVEYEYHDGLNILTLKKQIN